MGSYFCFKGHKIDIYIYTIILCVALSISLGIITYLIQKLKSVPQQIKEAREEALKKQRSVIKGQIGEQLVPFLNGFPYKPTDLKFFGNGFDYLAVVNMSEAREKDEEIIKEVVFIDIKAGNAQLSKIQRKIRDAIADGRVAWETITINEDNSLKIKRAKPTKTLDNSTECSII